MFIYNQVIPLHFHSFTWLNQFFLYCFFFRIAVWIDQTLSFQQETCILHLSFRTRKRNCYFCWPYWSKTHWWHRKCNWCYIFSTNSTGQSPILFPKPLSPLLLFLEPSNMTISYSRNSCCHLGYNPHRYAGCSHCHYCTFSTTIGRSTGIHKQRRHFKTRTKALMAVSQDENNVYVVWWTNKSENWEVMFRASNDGGATFGDKINLSNSTDTESQNA